MSRIAILQIKEVENTEHSKGSTSGLTSFESLDSAMQYLRERVRQYDGGEEFLRAVDERYAREQRVRSHVLEEARADARAKAERENAVPGSLRGVDCPLCKNRGYIAKAVGISVCMQECECMNARRALERIRRSGMADLLERHTFENFDVREAHCKRMAEIAQEFVQSPEGWLYAGGQVGSGKTHICTAVCRELIVNRRRDVRYMLWRDETDRLRGEMNTEEYMDDIERLVHADVLYIDDFLKTRRRGQPSDSDVKIAFEVLNGRYNRRAATILSSEWTIAETLEIDEALGSRILEMARGHVISVARDPKKNWRMR